VRRVRALVIGLGLSAVSGVVLLDADASTVSTGAPPTTGVPVEVLGTTEIRPVPVVRVTAIGCGWRSIGSGVLLPGGHVLTARHVLDGADHARVELGGVVVDAELIAVDASGRDAALLDAPALADRAGAFVDGRSAVTDTTVRVLGHPSGRALAERTGAVLGWLDDGPLALDGGRVLTLDVTVADGMSGGPVVDASGALVGVAIGYESNTRTGIAVPIDELGALLDGVGLAPSGERAC
jgi:S1-C subfamily serine protease